MPIHRRDAECAEKKKRSENAENSRLRVCLHDLCVSAVKAISAVKPSLDALKIHPRIPLKRAYNSTMRLLATADLHYNHARSRALAEQVIDDMNRAGGD